MQSINGFVLYINLHATFLGHKFMSLNKAGNGAFFGCIAHTIIICEVKK